jgi:hypothetical protein
MSGVDIDAATDELYALAPDGFLARRAELAAAARSDGDRELAKEIRALRKPSVAAWAVNRMVRTRPDEVAQLTDLAARLRTAQQTLDGPAIQQLGRERARLVDALVKATAEVASEDGATLSAAASRDAADTFVAALAAPDATAAVVSGRLTRTLSYAGFGDVDLSDATARPLRVVKGEAAAASAAPTDTGDEAAGAPVDPRVEQAEARLRTAMNTATETARKRSVVAAEMELAETRVAQLARDMARARAHRDATGEALAGAEVADEAAQAEVQAAREALDELRK